jgi:hypothetical protein
MEGIISDDGKVGKPKPADAVRALDVRANPL